MSSLQGYFIGCFNSLNQRKSKLLSLVGAIAVGVGLFGCVVAYKTSDFRSSLAQGLASVNSTYSQIEADHSTKKALFEQTIRDAGQPKVSPYQQMRSLLSKMTAAKGKFEKERAQMQADQQAVDAIAAAKDRVRSDEAEFKTIQGVRDRWEDSVSRLQKVAKQYQEASTELVQFASANGFRQLETNQIRAQADKISVDYKAAMIKVQEQIASATAVVNSQAEDKKATNQVLLKEIQELVDQIKSKESTILAALKSLSDALPANQKVLVGPKSPYEAKLKNVESLIAEVNQLSAQVQSRGQRLVR